MSLKHWEEINKNSQKLQSRASKMLRAMKTGKKNKGLRKFKKQAFKKKKQQWIQPKYAVYIKSKEWFSRRQVHFSKNGEFCVICFISERIEVHHISYRHLGRELDEELVSLCRDHHAEYHKKYGVTRDNKNTHKFIIEQRELLDFPIIR